MKLFRINFIAEEDLLLLNDIPDIINESKIVGLNLEFYGGGWDSEDQYCYHEWKGSGDIEMAKKFFQNHYGKFLCEVIIKDLHENNKSHGTEDNASG